MAALTDDDLRFAPCRSMGHEWRHGRPFGVDDTISGVRAPHGASTGAVGLPSTCSECGMERVRWITRSGEVVTRYRAPEGYSRHGDDVLSARQWRQGYVAVVFDELTAAVTKAPRRGRRSAA